MPLREGETAWNRAWPTGNSVTIIITTIIISALRLFQNKRKKHVYFCLLLFHSLQQNPLQLSVHWLNASMCRSRQSKHWRYISGCSKSPTAETYTRGRSSRLATSLKGSVIHFFPGSLLFKVLYISVLSQCEPRELLWLGFLKWNLARGRWSRMDLLCVCVLLQWLCYVLFHPGTSRLYLNRNTLCSLL